MNCRFCKTKLKKEFLDIGKSALANSFNKSKRQSIEQKKLPLILSICDNCLLIQHSSKISHTKIFDEYSYFSSYSQDTLDHSKEYIKKIEKYLNKSDNILEIACNDGYLLQYFDKEKYNIFGIEPAKNVAKVAKENGVNVINDYFNQSLSQKIKKKNFKLIVCNNVFAHIPNIYSFTKGLNNICTDETVITIEVQHVHKLIKANLIDMIYHEHYYYHSLKSIINLFKEFKLEVFKCEEITTHGGSLRFYISRKNKYKKDNNLKKILDNEKNDIFNNIYNKKQNLIQRRYNLFFNDTKIKLDEIFRKNKVVGFGAAAKSTTLINIFNLSVNEIKMIADDTPYKQGCYIPGSNIPIVNPDLLEKESFDYIIIFAWNYFNTIKKRLRKAFPKAKFIRIVPKLEISK
tara:strand:- start:21026 stop:22234 length:1209 start_codon:yes stop_codon:yes gene_type:complete